ncbi:carboxypeptidase M32 [Fluviispira sanaruensis]|uniref:Metal-dependent carboxypeptidase n=1 Tax=Fluviispira sanaruensis TaxID=2493639 RepID=A0A4P2VN28_FLUSA|nr:carboxypeptidase M32 [Fluviispira sanaruensis]BBH53350.1 carboxypeptidase M32 [Fluviispira sanaruensis]
MTQHEKFKILSEKFAEITDLRAASSVLYWDQNTYMPPQGAEARGRQMATLSKVAHEKVTNAQIEKLFSDLEGYEKDLPYESHDASFLRLARREYELATKVPADFIAKMVQHFSVSYEAWIRAKGESNFKLIEPFLEKSVDLSLQYSEFFPHKHILDPLIAEQDYGFTAESITNIFSELRSELVPFAKDIISTKKTDFEFLNKKYPKKNQQLFVEKILTEIGYDFSRGRLDLTHHPFMISFALGDIRITNRYDENNFNDSVFGAIHELGHAFYELGNAKELDGNILFGGTSAGVHESQSRLWENMVGRSIDFWQYFYKDFQMLFPEQLKNVSLKTFYAGINNVTPSLIRTESDEVTYNLHVMIRFNLEKQLLEGKLKVKELPEAWNACYLSDLGVKVPDDSHGCLQDVHWYAGLVGGSFQGYTLGNLMSAQFFDAASADLPNLNNDIKNGDFTQLQKWLIENIYCHGKKFTGPEVLKKATKKDLNIANYMNYLKRKFPIK